MKTQPQAGKAARLSNGTDLPDIPVRKRKSVLYNLGKFKVLYLMFLPGILFLLVNNYMPMFGVLIAFKNVNYADGIWGSPWSGWDNFKYLFSTSDAWEITRNTLAYNTVFIALNLIVGVGLAILLNEVKNKAMSKLYQSLMLLPYFLSMIVVSYLVLAFLGKDSGFMNSTILQLFGGQPIDWYSEPKYWPYILPLVNTWKNIGYYAVIYLAAVVGIDEEYYEAAVLDGASKWHQIRFITVPFLVPLIVIMTLLQIGRIFYADFSLFYQVPLESGALFPVTNVLDTYVYRTFLIGGDIGMSSAAGLYQAVVGFVLVLVSNTIVRRMDKDNALF
ncbi:MULTISPECIES: ABC transporter permease [Paenibacillus]|uniref:Aldouronate transport system permease protein n=1 Tax=Paenibacillus pabuli TaxID=1472 RepID=A0A855XYU8_9BACL|nr:MULTISPECIES: ABC transporter permease subunit [Paenibacillus]PWW39643.1 putative aldouronate transport system permease protein [Paenibacillus pabuli]PXW06891.1 putative aldouronate transport system permease protein [Paenibacillus taichungensis]RAJ01206.1 putative aldouronate transport system permease protein [Paenibacillus pabuli]